MRDRKSKAQPELGLASGGAKGNSLEPGGGIASMASEGAYSVISTHLPDSDLGYHSDETFGRRFVERITKTRSEW